MTTGNPYEGHHFPLTPESIDSLRDEVLAYIAETTARSHGLPKVLEFLELLEHCRDRKRRPVAV